MCANTRQQFGSRQDETYAVTTRSTMDRYILEKVYSARSWHINFVLIDNMPFSAHY